MAATRGGRRSTAVGAAGSDRWAALLLWAVLLVVIAVRFAEPIQDGDPFWHMAYAKQMLARGTLALDHTAFSWTPASNRTIYCAWAAELWLYWLWERLGPWSLFALRYAVVMGVVALGASYARRARLGSSVVTPAALVVFVLLSQVGTLIKPELFSFLFFNLTLRLYFREKLRQLAGESSALRFYLVPLVVLIWVNHHGGFVLVAPFLLATLVGELLNLRISPQLALSRRMVAHMAASWALCGVAVTLTPYGVAYPIQLFQDYVLGLTPRPDVGWNAAHRAVFDPAALGLHLTELALVALGAVVAVTWLVARTARAGARVDFAVVLLNTGYLLLFLPQLRTTYVWPAVAVYTVFYLARVARRQGAELPSLAAWPAIRGLAIGLALFAGGRAIYEARYRPLDNSWLGFGIGTGSPVAEAEFLSAAHLGPRLYNIFDSGGYLLWRLDPEYKVMTDSRSFPYLAWFDDQYRFTNGDSFADFLRKYPADVAVIDLAKDACVRNFLNAPDWTLAYFGQTAAVFTKSTVKVPSAALAAAPARFTDIRSPSAALRVFDFAVLAADYRTAWTVLDQLETRHKWSLDAGVLRSAGAYRDAHRALRTGDFVRARQLFAVGIRGPVVSRRDARILELLRSLDRAPSSGAATEIAIELRRLAAPS